MKKTNKGLKVFWYPYSIYLYPKASKKSNFAAKLEIDQIGCVSPLDHCVLVIKQAPKVRHLFVVAPSDVIAVYVCYTQTSKLCRLARVCNLKTSKECLWARTPNREIKMHHDALGLNKMIVVRAQLLEREKISNLPEFALEYFHLRSPRYFFFIKVINYKILIWHEQNPLLFN